MKHLALAFFASSMSLASVSANARGNAIVTGVEECPQQCEELGPRQLRGAIGCYDRAAKRLERRFGAFVGEDPSRAYATIRTNLTIASGGFERLEYRLKRLAHQAFLKRQASAGRFVCKVLGAAVRHAARDFAAMEAAEQAGSDSDFAQSTNDLIMRTGEMRRCLMLAGHASYWSKSGVRATSAADCETQYEASIQHLASDVLNDLHSACTDHSCPFQLATRLVQRLPLLEWGVPTEYWHLPASRFSKAGTRPINGLSPVQRRAMRNFAKQLSPWISQDRLGLTVFVLATTNEVNDDGEAEKTLAQARGLAVANSFVAAVKRHFAIDISGADILRRHVKILAVTHSQATRFSRRDRRTNQSVQLDIRPRWWHQALTFSKARDPLLPGHHNHAAAQSTIDSIRANPRHRAAYRAAYGRDWHTDVRRCLNPKLARARDRKGCVDGALRPLLSAGVTLFALPEGARRPAKRIASIPSPPAAAPPKTPPRIVPGNDVLR